MVSLCPADGHGSLGQRSDRIPVPHGAIDAAKRVQVCLDLWATGSRTRRLVQCHAPGHPSNRLSLLVRRGTDGRDMTSMAFLLTRASYASLPSTRNASPQWDACENVAPTCRVWTYIALMMPEKLIILRRYELICGQVHLPSSMSHTMKTDPSKVSDEKVRGYAQGLANATHCMFPTLWFART
jgi:hypothetical protein